MLRVAKRIIGLFLLTIATAIAFQSLIYLPAVIGLLTGLSSSVLENIPTMSIVLAMSPEMSLGQWLLVTLSTGVGGSLLSIGSAAGIALMGQSHGNYTFFTHLRWTPVIALGYVASIQVHLWLNSSLF